MLRAWASANASEVIVVMRRRQMQRMEWATQDTGQCSGKGKGC